MSSLEPARLWEFRKRKCSLPKGYHPDWYPTKPAITFLDSNQVMGGRGRRIADAWLQRVIRQARKDPNAFIELIMTGWEDKNSNFYAEFMHQSWIHQEIQRLLNKGTRGFAPDSVVATHRKAAIAVPRGIGKTTQIEGRCLWEIGHNPDISIMIVSETDKVAHKRVQAIKAHIERNPWVKLVFPHLKPGPKDSWTNTRIIVNRSTIKKDATVEGAGVLSSGTGNRCSLLIGDDVVGRGNALVNKAKRPQVKSAWTGLWEPMLTKGGREWFIFTPWHHEDLCHEVVKSKDFVTMFAAVTQDFETPWPERWAQNELRKLYENSYLKSEFARAYFLQASDANDSPVNTDLIEFFDASRISTDGLYFILSADLAIGKKKTSDYFAITLAAVNPTTGDKFIIDYINAHLTVPQQIKKIQEWTEKYSPRWILVETVAYQEALAQLLREKFGRYPKVISFKPTVDKRLRLELAAPALESGVVKLNGKLDEARPECHKPLMIRQLRDFGVTPHDDVCDSLTQFILWSMDKFSKKSRRSTLKAYTLG